MGPMTSKARFEPCGPIVDPAAAGRIHGLLAEAAREGGWEGALEAAWPALAPVFSASAYLTSLVRRRPERLAAILDQGPEARLAAILKDTAAVGEGDPFAESSQAGQP